MIQAAVHLRTCLDRVAERLERAYEADEIARPDPLMSELRDIFQDAGMVEDGGVCRFMDGGSDERYGAQA